MLFRDLPGRRQSAAGGLQAARRLGRDDYRNLVAFSSLSKRSNVPGLRSGFVAGDAALIGRFLLYRTYHGSAMRPHCHGRQHRRLDRRGTREGKPAHVPREFDAVLPILRDVLNVDRPQASFYLWAGTSGPDTAFVRDLYGRTGVTCCPAASARDAHGVNPGENRVRLALVAPLAECVQAAERIAHFVKTSV